MWYCIEEPIRAKGREFEQQQRRFLGQMWVQNVDSVIEKGREWPGKMDESRCSAGVPSQSAIPTLLRRYREKVWLIDSLKLRTHRGIAEQLKI